MSLIGSLEQFDLANILRRIEVFAKTGLIVVKSNDVWAEFYFRQGQLVCTGPVRTNATLIDRLLQANLLSVQALPTIVSLVDSSDANETRQALTLINAGYLSREVLRAWASQEASQILRSVLNWSIGEIYFEDDCPTPNDRLLVALSVSSLLDVLTSATPRAAGLSAPSTDETVTPSQPLQPQMPAHFMPQADNFQPQSTEPVRASFQPPMQQSHATRSTGSISSTPAPGSLNASQLLDGVPPFASPAPAAGSLNASQLLDGVPPFANQPMAAAGNINASQLIEDLPFNSPASLNTPPSFSDLGQGGSLGQASAPSTGFLGAEIDIPGAAPSSLIPPQPVMNPLPPARIDTSFMTPDLVLIPVDLSSIRERNPQVQLTPDQWSLFVLIDGQATLQMLCQMLMAPADVVCMLAGELIAIGLVMPLTAGLAMNAFNEFSTAGREYHLASQGAQLPMPQGPATGQAPVWPPATSVQGSGPIETQSQWGNGNNGATFMVGGGWVLTPKQGQNSAPSGQSGFAYAPGGVYR